MAAGTSENKLLRSIILKAESKRNFRVILKGEQFLKTISLPENGSQSYAYFVTFDLKLGINIKQKF